MLNTTIHSCVKCNTEMGRFKEFTIFVNERSLSVLGCVKIVLRYGVQISNNSYNKNVYQKCKRKRILVLDLSRNGHSNSFSIVHTATCSLEYIFFQSSEEVRLESLLPELSIVLTDKALFYT